MDHKHGEGCGCSHESKTEDMAVLYNLYSKIEKDNLECLNESQEGSGKLVFRPWDERMLKDKVFCWKFSAVKVSSFSYCFGFILVCGKWCRWGTSIQHSVIFILPFMPSLVNLF